MASWMFSNITHSDRSLLMVLLFLWDCVCIEIERMPEILLPFQYACYSRIPPLTDIHHWFSHSGICSCSLSFQSFPHEDGKEPWKPQKKRGWSQKGALIMEYTDFAHIKDAKVNIYPCPYTGSGFRYFVVERGQRSIWLWTCLRKGVAQYSEKTVVCQVFHRCHSKKIADFARPDWKKIKNSLPEWLSWERMKGDVMWVMSY